MSFTKIAEARYSVRKFASRKVEAEKIEAVLRAASLAPTGCNNQPQRILVAEEPSVLEKIRRCTRYQFGAPVTFVVCYDTESCWINPEGEPIGQVDASIVTSYMQLAAVEEGLGTCWVACFDRESLRRELAMPARFMPVALLPMGYPAEDAEPAPRHFEHRPSRDFTFWNRF